MTLLTGYITNCFAQDLSPDALSDTLPVRILDSVIINARSKQFNTSYLTDVTGTKIYAGKRTNALTLSQNINGPGHFTSRWKNISHFPGRGYLIKFFYSDTHTSIAG